jgi:tetratricopeptide (TPR) repeat protein
MQDEIEKLIDSEEYDTATSLINKLELDEIANLYRLQIMLKQGQYIKAQKFISTIKITDNQGELYIKYLIELADLNLNLGKLDEVDRKLSEFENLYQTKYKERKEYEQLFALSLNKRGLLEWKKGNFKEALKHYQKAVNNYNKLSIQREKAAVLNNIGLINTDLGNFEIAKNYYQQAHEICCKLGDKKKEAGVLNNIGILYRLQRKWNEALEFNFKSLEINNKLNNLPQKAQVLNSIGTVYYDKSDIETALNYFRDSLEIKKEIGNPLEIGIAYINIALMFLTKGDFQNAMLNFDKSYEIKEIYNNKEMKFHIYLSKVDIHKHTGEYEKALKFIEKSLEVAKDIGNKQKLSQCYQQKSTIEYALEEYDQAYHSLSLAKEYISQLPNDLRLAEIHFQDILVAISKDELETKLDILNELEVLANNSDDINIIAIHEIVLALFELKKNRFKNKLTAENYLNSTLSKNISLEYKSFTLNYLSLLKIDELKIEPREEIIDETKRLIKQAIEIAKKRNHLANIVEANLTESKLLFVLGDYKKATNILLSSYEFARMHNMIRMIKLVENEIKTQKETINKLENKIEDSQNIKDRLEKIQLNEYIESILKLKSQSKYQ